VWRPHEEALFFVGYGAVQVDPEAIVYYRYERILEDMGVDGASVFAVSGTSEATRQAQVDLIMSFFAPGGDLESAEQVWTPGCSASRPQLDLQRCREAATDAGRAKPSFESRRFQVD